MSCGMWNILGQGSNLCSLHLYNMLRRSVVCNSVTPWTEPARLLYPWDFPGKNTGVSCHFLLQGIFPTQGSTWVSCIAGRFYQLSHQGRPTIHIYTYMYIYISFRSVQFSSVAQSCRTLCDPMNLYIKHYLYFGCAGPLLLRAGFL